MTVTMQDATYYHFKFIVPDENPISVDINTLTGEIEYEITLQTPNDDEFGLASDKRNTTVIHKGTSKDNHFVFNKEHDAFNKLTLYYLTIKSNSFYSRLVLTVGHVGQYKLISETAPPAVKVTDSPSLYYYTIDPNPGKSRIILEAFPTNKLEKFSIYTKIVSLLLTIIIKFICVSSIILILNTIG